jgi:hypothetical protein
VESKATVKSGWRRQLHPATGPLDGTRGGSSIARRTGSKPQVAAMVSAETP